MRLQARKYKLMRRSKFTKRVGLLLAKQYTLLPYRKLNDVRSAFKASS